MLTVFRLLTLLILLLAVLMDLPTVLPFMINSPLTLAPGK